MSSMHTSVAIKIKSPNREQECIQVIGSGKGTISESNEYDATNKGQVKVNYQLWSIGLHSSRLSSAQ